MTQILPNSNQHSGYIDNSTKITALYMNMEKYKPSTPVSTLLVFLKEKGIIDNYLYTLAIFCGYEKQDFKTFIMNDKEALQSLIEKELPFKFSLNNTASLSKIPVDVLDYLLDVSKQSHRDCAQQFLDIFYEHYTLNKWFLFFNHPWSENWDTYVINPFFEKKDKTERLSFIQDAFYVNKNINGTTLSGENAVDLYLKEINQGRVMLGICGTPNIPINQLFKKKLNHEDKLLADKQYRALSSSMIFFFLEKFYKLGGNTTSHNYHQLKNWIDRDDKPVYIILDEKYHAVIAKMEAIYIKEHVENTLNSFSKIL